MQLQNSDLFTALVLFLFMSCCEGVMECMSGGGKIDCFECNSDEDIRCLDPFNFTSRLEDMPSRIQCDGCCMKLVSKAGTDKEHVRRTCTDLIDINLFMVGHVCMTDFTLPEVLPNFQLLSEEGGGGGHMCFCEEDDCNGAKFVLLPPFYLTILISGIAVKLLT